MNMPTVSKVDIVNLHIVYPEFSSHNLKSVKIYSICLPLPTSVNNKGKLIFLLSFYVSPLQKKKKKIKKVI